MTTLTAAEKNEFRASLDRFVSAAIDLMDMIDGDADYEQETGVDQDIVPVSMFAYDIRPAKHY